MLFSCSPREMVAWWENTKEVLNHNMIERKKRVDEHLHKKKLSNSEKNWNVLGANLDIEWFHQWKTRATQSARISLIASGTLLTAHQLLITIGWITQVSQSIINHKSHSSSSFQSARSHQSTAEFINFD